MNKEWLCLWNITSQNYMEVCDYQLGESADQSAFCLDVYKLEEDWPTDLAQSYIHSLKTANNLLQVFVLLDLVHLSCDML